MPTRDHSSKKRNWSQGLKFCQLKYWTFPVYSVQCTVSSVQCTVYSIQFTEPICGFKFYPVLLQYTLLPLVPALPQYISPSLVPALLWYTPLLCVPAVHWFTPLLCVPLNYGTDLGMMSFLLFQYFLINYLSGLRRKIPTFNYSWHIQI